MITKNPDLSNNCLALTNGQLILPYKVESGKTILIKGNQILDIVDDFAADIGEVIDVDGRYIAPGLIDIHIHGARGYTFNDGSADAFAAITAQNVKQGVTSVLATLATDSIPQLLDCLEFCRRWMADSPTGCQVLGVHLEGPYFSREQRGAQDERNLRTPDDGTPDILLRHADVIKMMSFAPELPGALALTTKLNALGIVPAAGHSATRDTDVSAAISRGLRHAIHLWSGQSSTVREGPWRKPGLLEATLASDTLTAEMIADNKHLPPTLMKLAYKCLGPDRLCIVSDATSGAGLPNGSPFRMGAVEYVVGDGVGMTLDGTSFAGSTTLLNDMLPILTNVVSIPLAEAVRMAALTPARVIGVSDRKGSLEPGKDADLVIFEDDFTTWKTMVAGQWVYAVEQ